MRSVLVLLMTIGCAQLSAASPCSDTRPWVSVQIHDYVHVKGEFLSTATELVTRAYKDVGVGIEWVGVMAFDVDRAPSGVGRIPVAQLTINILTPAMAAKSGISAGVLGFVAVPPEGGSGRIGYVVYEGVPRLAAATEMSVGEVLGVVVAQDIRRLILGAEAKSSDDLLGEGSRRERERVNPFALQFTPQDVSRLHATLERNSASGCRSNDVQQ